MNRHVFSPFHIALFIAAAVALFTLSILLKAYDTSPVSTGSRTAPGSYSLAATGYAGAFAMLKDLDYPVYQSVANPMGMAGLRGLLIVAEPELPRVDGDAAALFGTARRLLIILPKWSGTADPGRPAWLKDAEPCPEFDALRTLRLVSGEGRIMRAALPDGGVPWDVNKLDITPQSTGFLQLMRDPTMKPLVAYGKDILLGELTSGSQRIWVLSDPDVMNNHGLSQGRNAAFSVAMLHLIRSFQNGEADAPIVFDETLHGYQAPQNSSLKLAFSYPFVIFTALFGVGIILVAFAGASRFGAPSVSDPTTNFGKTQLMENGARILDYSGQHAFVLRKYTAMIVQSVAETLHAPRRVQGMERIVWLDRIGKNRNVHRPCSNILRDFAETSSHEPDPAKASKGAVFAENATTRDKKRLARQFQLARELHQWKGEILDGSSTDRRHR